MGDANDVVHVIEGIYAATAAPDQWTRALEGVVDLLHGHHATLDVHGSEPVGSAFVAKARLDERELASVLAPAAMRTLAALAAAVPLGVATRDAIVSDRDFERSAIYNDVFRRINGFHSLTFRRNGTSGGLLLTVCRPQRAGNFEAMDVTRCGSSRPTLRPRCCCRAACKGPSSGKPRLRGRSIGWSGA